MGNRLQSTPPNLLTDKRVQKCSEKYRLRANDVNRFYSVFAKWDDAKHGMITITDFYEGILHQSPSTLSEEMLRFVDAKKFGAITFGEFVEFVCTFSVFEENELLRLVFMMLDHERKGALYKEQIKHFLHDLHAGSGGFGKGNLDAALRNMQEDAGGLVKYEFLKETHIKYPITFYPVFSLQLAVINCVFNERFWTMKKIELYEESQLAKFAQHGHINSEGRARQEKMRAENENPVKARMGAFRYYACPWRRDIARKQLQRISAIDLELEQLTDAAMKEEMERELAERKLAASAKPDTPRN